MQLLFTRAFAWVLGVIISSMASIFRMRKFGGLSFIDERKFCRMVRYWTFVSVVGRKSKRRVESCANGSVVDVGWHFHSTC
jgi:hypothetical protein